MYGIHLRRAVAVAMRPRKRCSSTCYRRNAVDEEPAVVETPRRLNLEPPAPAATATTATAAVAAPRTPGLLTASPDSWAADAEATPGA
jgi:hypothetical protein